MSLLCERDFPENMVAQHEARSKESIRSTFEMACDPAQQMEVPAVEA